MQALQWWARVKACPISSRSVSIINLNTERLQNAHSILKGSGCTHVAQHISTLLSGGLLWVCVCPLEK